MNWVRVERLANSSFSGCPTVVVQRTGAEMSEPEVYLAIGRFVFWFSKLEGMLKADLAGLLDLENEHLDPVTSAFDFAQLLQRPEGYKA
jgi:hypothetical protein